MVFLCLYSPGCLAITIFNKATYADSLDVNFSLKHLSRKQWTDKSSASEAPYPDMPYEILGSTIDLKRWSISAYTWTSFLPESS